MIDESYMHSIWERALAQSPTEPLQVVIPVVLAQNDREWKARPEFGPLFDVPEHLAADLRPFLPDFAFRLIQLAQIPFDAIRGTPAGVVVLRTMKAERSGRLLDEIVWDEPLLAQIPRALFEAFVLYLSNADVDNEALERNLMNIEAPEVRNTAMTLARKYRQEGRQEGRLAVLRENVLEALELRYDTVPPGLANVIQGLEDEAKLRLLHRQAIRCGSLEDFARGL